MATIPFSGYVYRSDHTPASGVRVRAYPVNADRTVGASFVETTSASDGYWQLSVDPATLPSPTGLYDIELFDPSTNQTRWIRSSIQMQIVSFVGPNGSAPIADGSITSAKIADSAVTDAKIGTRTVSDANAPSGDSGTLATLLGFLANRIKAITGKASWRDNPRITLEQAMQAVSGSKRIFVQSTAPSSPLTDDVWIDTSQTV